MRSARVLALMLLVPVACTGGAHSPRQTRGGSSAFAPSPTPAAAPSAAPSASPAAFLPAPNAPIPKQPAQVATSLTTVTNALDRSIADWRTRGTNGKPPVAIVLQALYQQRLCRALANDSGLAAAVIARLPSRVAQVPRAVIGASRLLSPLTKPVASTRTFTTGPPEPAGVLLRYYREAERRFGVPWNVLAAVNYFESKFGKVRAASYAGAQGPMQFIPSTWAAYGMGGDINDPHDAILGAANYLHRSGAPADVRRALYAYNRAWAYVDAVLLYARLMGTDIRNYFALYNWQVFVLTPNGAVRITGPGAHG